MSLRDYIRDHPPTVTENPNILKPNMGDPIVTDYYGREPNSKSDIKPEWVDISSKKMFISGAYLALVSACIYKASTSS